MRIASFAFVLFVLSLAPSARAQDRDAAPPLSEPRPTEEVATRVVDTKAVAHGLALFAASYAFSATMGAVYQTSTDTYGYDPGYNGYAFGPKAAPVGAVMAIPVVGPYMALFSKNPKLDMSTLLSARLVAAGAKGCDTSSSSGSCMAGTLAMVGGIYMIVPELALLLVGQPLGLVIALDGAIRGKLHYTTAPEKNAAKLTLAPAPIPHGGGLALSLTSW